MSKVVIDASVAVKWVVEERDTPSAISLLMNAKLIAPDLLVAECADILWKKYRNREITKDHALMAANLLERSEIELFSTRSLLECTTQIAGDLSYPAYDCLYLALAIKNKCHFVTADEDFYRIVQKSRFRPFSKFGINVNPVVLLSNIAPDRPLQNDDPKAFSGRKLKSSIKVKKVKIKKVKVKKRPLEN